MCSLGLLTLKDPSEHLHEVCLLLLKFPLLEVYGDVGFAGLGLGPRENFHHFFVSL